MKTARCQSWQRFVSSINSRTSLKKVWNIVNKISGKRPAIEVKHLQDGDKEGTSLADLADTLAENFSKISSSHHYNVKFQSHEEGTESQPLRFNSNDTEAYRQHGALQILYCIYCIVLYHTHFTMDSIAKSSDSAVGPDDIHYQMLKLGIVELCDYAHA